MKNQECLIYIADLVQNYDSKGPHIIPLNIGYIAAYARKVYGDRIKIRLFKYPLDLVRAIKEDNPDIVALSCYTWNQNINKEIIKWVKSLSENIVTAFGGPDFPYDEKEQLVYMRERPDLDFYILNQGESGFVKLLERFFQEGTPEKMKTTPLGNSLFYKKELGESLVYGEYDPITDFSQIPSPWLSGTLDEFFEKNLIPLVETNRGCPYQCTYCAWGKASRGKVLLFPFERVKKEVEYIAKRMDKIQLLMIGDANFGLYERDVELSEFLIELNKKYGFPRDLMVSWAKTGSDRLIKMADILNKIMGLAAAFGSFQTTDPQVMKNIKRKNLSWKDFQRIQKYFTDKGISTSSDLILGLPGETGATHLKGLRDLFDHNTTSMFCYNLRMLGGSEFNTNENREKYGVKTKFRLIDGGYGKYDEIMAIESEEIVLETNTISMDETLSFRAIHFLIQFIWNYKYYGELIFFSKHLGINLIDIVLDIIDGVDKAPGPVKTVFSEFKKETYDEWFDTEEELISHYSIPENFEFITSGGFGKMNFKYMYKVLLECKEDFDTYLFSIVETILKKENKYSSGVQSQLENLLRFTCIKFIDFKQLFHDNPEFEKEASFEYDIATWKMKGFQTPLSDYKKDSLSLKFYLPEERLDSINKRYERYKTDNFNQTLRKMVEDMNEKDLFYEIDYQGS
jgi:radical SAM superfamily enzyme YgiQ (UPF0313 family)